MRTKKRIRNNRSNISRIIIAIAVILLFTDIPAPFSLSKSVQGKINGPVQNSKSKNSILATYMIPMRDGVELATDVYLPINTAPHGVLLVRTPYDKSSSAMAAIGLMWVGMGWPTVIQDMRGYYASQGNDTLFMNDSTDGYDTINWIGQQSWCNGKVGGWGPSALGINQYLYAKATPPDLKSQFVECGSPDMYNYIAFPGGEFRKALVTGWVNSQNGTGRNATAMLPVIEGNSVKSSFWNPVVDTGFYNQIEVPAVHKGGWYDCFGQGTIEAYLGYNNQGGPGARNSSMLIMGPWTHVNSGSQSQGQLSYPLNSLDTFSSNILTEEANYYLQGDNSSGLLNEPKVRYYVMGDVNDSSAPGNYWRSANVWPIPSKDIPFYFDGNTKGLNTSIPSNGVNEYDFNPTNPVPSVGGAELTISHGPYDQRSVENRSDVLVYTTPPLQQAFECTGHVTANLYISSNCTDTDFTVKLSDVYPDGRSMLVCDGIFKTRFRDGFDKEVFMTPGSIYKINVDLWSTSLIFNKGHMIRVAISSSNYPRFDVNPNTGDTYGHNTTYKIAHNKVYLGELYPSCIILPTPSEMQVPVLSVTPKTSDNRNYWINWTQTLGATGYVLQEDNSPTFLSSANYTINGQTNISLLFTGKATGVFYYRVKAFNSTTNTTWSNIVSIGVGVVPELIIPAIFIVSVLLIADISRKFRLKHSYKR